MKKLLFTIAACLVAVIATAQPMGGRPMGGRMPMGGANKPFYELESDSIANARIQDVAGYLDLTEKQFDKILKLYAQEFEELCRNLQMSVREYQMMQNGGFRARKIYNQIIEKYDKRYKKALNEDQYAKWKELPGTTMDNKFSSILQHVKDNTQSMF